MNQKHEKLTDDICRVLDQSIASLDEQTKRRLQQARFTALEKPARGFPFRLRWAFASGATAMVILGLLLLPLSHETQDIQSGMTDIALLTSNDSLELFKHDAEFYLWLAETM